MSQAKNDPVIDEVREVRRRISARFNHDPARLVAYYIQLQEEYRDISFEKLNFSIPESDFLRVAFETAPA